MFQLGNGQLRIDVLDPADPADRRLLGARFCWGGYVWQVHDAVRGPLLAGPEWPNPQPDPFNGQGLPESFRARELGTNRPLTIDDQRGFAIGIGEVETGSRGEIVVARPCDWSVEQRDAAIMFRAAHEGIGLACAVVRTIRLDGRSLTSTSEVTNTGALSFPLHWFVHPFFPLRAGRITCILPTGATINPNPGFTLDANGTLALQRPFRGQHDGHMEPIHLAPGAPFRVRIAHPAIAGIDLATDFAPSSCPVWANGHTFSIEPYLITDLAPGGTRRWSVRYDFGMTPPTTATDRYRADAARGRSA